MRVIISNTMAQLGRPPKYKSVRQLRKIINEYFAECDPHWVEEEYYDYPFIEESKELEAQSHGGALKRVRAPKRDYSQPMVLQRRWIKTEQKPYTMAGLARRLGLSRQGLMEYKRKGDDFSDTILEARAIVGEYNEQIMLSGKNATGAIFNARVNFGYNPVPEENPPPENPIHFASNVPSPGQEVLFDSEKTDETTEDQT